MEAKFSPRVKDVITYSREEALRLGHEYIGTEHLLLGMIRDGEGMAIKILNSLIAGVTAILLIFVLTLVVRVDLIAGGIWFYQQSHWLVDLLPWFSN